MNVSHRAIEYASFNRRLLAFMLDGVIITAASSVLALLLFGPEYFAEMMHNERSGEFNWLSNGYEQLFQLLWVLGCWHLWQATHGKLLMDCQIVDEQTLQPPRLRKLLLRYFGYILSMLPLGLGYLWILIDRNNRAWHDRLANTIVILEDDSRKTLSQLSPP